MSLTKKFYFCKKCGNLVEVIQDAGKPIICCDEVMTRLRPNTSEGATEKHLPVVEIQGARVCAEVGDLHHPMTQEHSIKWVYLETDQGCQRKELSPDEKPMAEFELARGEKPVAVYAYCNLHGFWKTEV